MEKEKSVVKNKSRNVTVPITSGGTCKTRGVIYAIECTKCNFLCVGHTGDKLSDRMAKHRYDIRKRPENNEVAEHFHQNHNINQDLRVMIIQSNLPTKSKRIFFEDRWMCRLQCL